MSEVIELKPRGSDPKKPAPPKFEGEYLLKLCAEWRIARAQLQKNWAEHQLATMWGLSDDADIELDLEPLSRMKEIEGHLAEIGEPRTMLGARELLGVAVTILAHEDPESRLAEGPVLEIVRNIIKSLEWCKGEIHLGPERPKLHG